MARATASPKTNEETTSGYFKRILREDPKLRRSKSSKPVFQRYLDDHPDEHEVSDRVRQIYYNVKSILKSRKRKRKAAKAATEMPEAAIMLVAEEVDTGPSELEQLEEQIDECLALAKSLDRDGLENVISNLRQARNQVVVKQGM